MKSHFAHFTEVVGMQKRAAEEQLITKMMVWVCAYGSALVKIVINNAAEHGFFLFMESHTHHTVIIVIICSSAAPTLCVNCIICGEESDSNF